MSVLKLWKPLLRSLRPHQWVKNLFVLAPVLFAKHIFEPVPLLMALGAFTVFCMLSGAIYLVNDLVDKERDRRHPRKRHRPIAAGLVPERVAWSLAALLFLAGLGASFFLGWRFSVVASGYVLLQVCYSYLLKNVIFLDVISIALGFLIRVIAGAFAIMVPISPWIVICTFLIALLLGFGKRKHELWWYHNSAANGGAEVKPTRKVLRKYRMGHLDIAIRVSALATVVSYFFYTISSATIVKFQFEFPWLLFTIPFTIFGILRYLHLVSRRHSAESPTDEILRDLPFMLNLVLYAMAAVLILYLGR